MGLGLSDCCLMLRLLQNMLRYLYILSTSIVLMSYGSILIDFRFSPSDSFGSFALLNCLRLSLLRMEVILLNLDEESLLESERLH